MATIISADKLVAAGRDLLAYVNGGGYIPYVPNGMTLSGMDCQGMCEYLLIQAGVPKLECGLAGSNAHWRACVWTGTPEECVAQFGRIPVGAFVFIHVDGRNDKYGDDLGNAGHMGIVLDDSALHASASRECVAESKFAGRTIPNGGWNAIGLPPWVDYGVAFEGLNQPVNGGVGVDEESDAEDGVTAPAANVAKPRMRYARVFASDGGTVKLRKERSQKCKTYWLVASDTRVAVERSRDGWALMTAVCTDGYRRRAWMMEDFLEYEVS